MREVETSGGRSLPFLFRRGKKRRPTERRENHINADLNRRQRRRRRRTRGSGSFCLATLPGGTIAFQVFDVHRRVIATQVGVCTTREEPDLKNNIVPDVFETGHGDGQGKQQ
ncbi:MAG: hypothetical protein EA424_03910 [Planctomycetaceae bacterium]|nr:MAG: hypothetical protein EA424_03910 [Planctomycetaceae bacterium]